MKKFLKHQLSLFVKNILKEELEVSEMKSSGEIHPTAKIHAARIHGNVTIAECASVSHAILGGNVSIGRYTSINGPSTYLYAEINKIIIGNFCSIARNVDIQEWNHPTDHLSTHPVRSRVFGTSQTEEMISKGNIQIGHDVWIGAKATILSGAKLGNGCVIAANSVVTGEVPPYSIVAGSPARVIKYRFNQSIIDDLLHIQWWEWDVEKLRKNKDLLTGPIDNAKLISIIG